ncbi:MAG: hypothetical protein JWM47_2203 [Acidimicrobiales bacterium]|nr:hypothetical protein [Acidimicrobiales bacterium]
MPPRCAECALANGTHVVVHIVELRCLLVGETSVEMSQRSPAQGRRLRRGCRLQRGARRRAEQVDTSQFTTDVVGVTRHDEGVPGVLELPADRLDLAEDLRTVFIDRYLDLEEYIAALVRCGCSSDGRLREPLLCAPLPRVRALLRTTRFRGLPRRPLPWGPHPCAHRCRPGPVPLAGPRRRPVLRRPLRAAGPRLAVRSSTFRRATANRIAGPAVPSMPAVLTTSRRRSSPMPSDRCSPVLVPPGRQGPAGHRVGDAATTG